MVFCFGRAISKSGRAKITFVGPISCVCIHVTHQLLVLNKTSTTDSVIQEIKLIQVRKIVQVMGNLTRIRVV